jgi:thiol-disulfide isomerase/thioredoxin
MALRLAPLPSHSSLVAPRCTARRQPHVRLAAQPEGGAPEPSTPPEAAPQETPQSSGRAVAGAAAAFGAALFFLSRATGGPSLSQLEADSLPIDQALRNGRPSVLEFYADWCEVRSRATSRTRSATPSLTTPQVCRESAPNVYDVERAQKGSLNFVMLNVDNVKVRLDARGASRSLSDSFLSPNAHARRSGRPR